MRVTVSPGVSPEILKLHQPNGASELLGREEKGTASVVNDSIVPELEAIVMSPVALVDSEELVVSVVEVPPCPGKGPGPGSLSVLVLVAVRLWLTATVVLAIEEALVDVERVGEADVELAAEVDITTEVEVTFADEALLVVDADAPLVDWPVDRLAEPEVDVEVTVIVGCAPGNGGTVRLLRLWPCVCVTTGVPALVEEVDPPEGAG